MQVTGSGLLCLGVALALSACSPKPDESPSKAAPPAASQPAGPADPETPADAVVGTSAPFAVGAPRLDSLGVALGQTLAQARAAFKAEPAKAGLVQYREILFGLPAPLEGRFISGLFADNVQRAGVPNDSLGVLLAGPPSSPQVWYVGRSIRYTPGQGPSAAGLLKSLTDKYGPPQRQQSSIYYWSWDEAGAPGGGQCGGMNMGSQVAGTATSPAMSMRSEGPQPPACARVMQVQISDYHDEVAEMDIGLTDNVILAKAREQTQAMVRGAATAPKGEAPKL